MWTVIKVTFVMFNGIITKSMKYPQGMCTAIGARQAVFSKNVILRLRDINPNIFNCSIFFQIPEVGIVSM